MSSALPSSRRALRRSRWLVAVPLFVVALAVLPAAPASAAGPKIVIGFLGPVDNGLVEFGRGMRDSVLLAARQAQDANRIKGWQLEVRVLDDSSDPAKGKASAATFAADKQVVAVVGPYNSGVAAKAAPVLAKLGIALVSPSNTLTSLTVGTDPAHPKRQWNTYFRLCGIDARQAEFLAAQAKQLGIRTVAVVSETKAVSKGLADEFVRAFKANGGTITVQQVVPDNATAADFAGFVSAALPTKPDLVFFGGEYNVGAVLRKTATTAGLTVPQMGGDGMFDPAFITGSGAAALGSYTSGVGVPLARIPNSAAWLAAYRAAGYTSAPSDYGPYAYDAANLVINQLIKSMKGRTSVPGDIRAQVVKALGKVSTEGLTGHLQFDKYGDATKPGFTLYKVQGTPPAWVAVN